MIHSRDRILTTHVGSLPRNEVLTDLLIRREAGEAIDRATMAAEMDRAVRVTVDAQIAAGIDVGNDGEQQRVGFQTYIPERMSGFGGRSKRKVGKDFQEVPELIEMFLRRFPKRSRSPTRRRRSGRCATGAPGTSRMKSRASRLAGRNPQRRSRKRS
jgi:5-methyltetrahydropteroyltriglutamate--homocysteine methyltransferase